MKKLSMFNKFDWEAFAKGKKFMAIGCREWRDYDTQEKKGIKLDFLIVEDKTDYGIQKDEEMATNVWEKGTFKIPKDIEIPENVQIVPKGVKATVYGEFRNQLSIEAEDIVIVRNEK